MIAETSISFCFCVGFLRQSARVPGRSSHLHLPPAEGRMGITCTEPGQRIPDVSDQLWDHRGFSGLVRGHWISLEPLFEYLALLALGWLS